MGDGRWARAMPSASPSELVQSKTHLIITTSAVGSGDVLDSDRQVPRLRKIWGGLTGCIVAADAASDKRIRGDVSSGGLVKL